MSDGDGCADRTAGADASAERAQEPTVLQDARSNSTETGWYVAWLLAGGVSGSP
jgi:hypothetical protein